MLSASRRADLVSASQHGRGRSGPSPFQSRRLPKRLSGVQWDTTHGTVDSIPSPDLCTERRPFDSSRAQRIATAQTRGCRPPTHHISQQPLGEALLLYRNGRTVDARINTLRRRDCRRRPRARQDHHRRHIEFLEVLSFRSAHLRRARISRRAEAATAARRDRSAAPCYPASSGIRHPGQIPEEGSYRSAPP